MISAYSFCISAFIVSCALLPTCVIVSLNSLYSPIMVSLVSFSEDLYRIGWLCFCLLCYYFCSFELGGLWYISPSSVLVFLLGSEMNLKLYPPLPGRYWVSIYLPICKGGPIAEDQELWCEPVNMVEAKYRSCWDLAGRDGSAFGSK